MPRCMFREQPPRLLGARLVEVARLREEVAESFYASGVDEIAVYPSLGDALRVLAELFGGLKPLTPLPSHIAAYAGEDGGAWLASNPTPTGEALDCTMVCSHEPIVVYEGGRVALPATSVATCDCRAYSVASLRDYGVDAETAWVAGLRGGVGDSSHLPGILELHRAVRLVKRLWARGMAAIASYTRPRFTGPFAAFVDEKLPILGEWRDGARYGAEGLYAYSLYMEPGCYTRVSPWRG